MFCKLFTFSKKIETFVFQWSNVIWENPLSEANMCTEVYDERASVIHERNHFQAKEYLITQHENNLIVI